MSYACMCVHTVSHDEEICKTLHKNPDVESTKRRSFLGVYFKSYQDLPKPELPCSMLLSYAAWNHFHIPCGCDALVGGYE